MAKCLFFGSTEKHHCTWPQKMGAMKLLSCSLLMVPLLKPKQMCVLYQLFISLSCLNFDEILDIDIAFEPFFS